MRYNIDPKRHITRARRFFAGLVLASAMGSAHGQTLTPPLRRPSSRRRTATLFSSSLQLRARKGTSVCPLAPARQPLPGP